MAVIQSVGDRIVPRLAGGRLAERLRMMPAVVLTGARQTGKTTLVRELTPGRRRYLSLDDLDAARRAASPSSCWRAASR